MWVSPKGVGAISVGADNPIAKLTVDGGIKIGAPASTLCTNSRKGIMGFFKNDPITSAVANAVYYCDGTNWKRF